MPIVITDLYESISSCVHQSKETIQRSLPLIVYMEVFWYISVLFSIGFQSHSWRLSIHAVQLRLLVVRWIF